MKIIYALFALPLLGACAAPSNSGGDPTAYRGYDVQVSAAGGAGCGALPASEIARAATHTSSVRTRSGQSSVSSNARLNRIAEQQACHMARTGLMSHAGPKNEGPKKRAQDAGYAPRIIAENIAAGPYDLTRVLAEWDRSPSHRANITLGQVRDFGIGMATGADGTRYWAAVYAGAR